MLQHPFDTEGSQYLLVRLSTSPLSAILTWPCLTFGSKSSLKRAFSLDQIYQVLRLDYEVSNSDLGQAKNWLEFATWIAQTQSKLLLLWALSLWNHFLLILFLIIETHPMKLPWISPTLWGAHYTNQSWH